MAAVTTPKQSTEPIKFRPGERLGPLIVDLMVELKKRDSGAELSAAIRDGLLAFWPQISAFLLVRQQSGLDAEKLAALTCICAKAQELGITADQVEETFAGMLMQRLAALPEAEPATRSGG